MAQRLILVRHGTTEWLERGLIQGASESDLTPRGVHESELTAAALKHIPFNIAFCSPMARARQTAAILCAPHRLEPVIIPQLHEIDFGCYEDAPFFEAPTPQDGLIKRLNLFKRILLMQLTGEKIWHVRRRARAALADMSALQPEGSLLVIAHGVILNYLIQELLGIRRTFHLQPCSISEVMVENGQATVVRTNDTAHLPSA